MANCRRHVHRPLQRAHVSAVLPSVHGNHGWRQGPRRGGHRNDAPGRHSHSAEIRHDFILMFQQKYEAIMSSKRGPYIVPFEGTHTIFENEHGGVDMASVPVEVKLQVAKKVINALSKEGLLRTWPPHFMGRDLINWSQNAQPEQFEEMLDGGYYYTPKAQSSVLDWIRVAVE